MSELKLELGPLRKNLAQVKAGGQDARQKLAESYGELEQVYLLCIYCVFTVYVLCNY